MTLRRTLLTGACSLLAIAAGVGLHVQFFSAAGEPAAVPMSAPAADPATFIGSQQAASPESADAGLAHPLAVFRNAASQHPAGVDPMIVLALENFSDAQIAAYNALHVLPFNAPVGKLCEQMPDPQLPGMGFEIERCETVRERPPHPYHQLDGEALQALAETDAAAALVMGMRVVGDDAARNRWYLRAAALSGKSGPILALANRRYASARAYKHSAEGQLELVDDVETVRYRAVLETIADRMGDPRANPSYWRSLLRQQTGAASVAGAADVEKQALEIMGQMARIQRDITGSTQMWELIHAA